MKLEYFYDNNNNVKYALKTFSILRVNCNIDFFYTWSF